MAKGDVKVDIRNIVRAHRATYVDATSGRRRVSDYVLMEGAPAAGFVGCLLLEVRIPPVLAAGLLTVSGILSALFFGVMLQVSDRAMSWADSEPPSGPKTSEHGIFLSELAANAGYASLVCIFAAVAYVIASFSHGWVLRVFSAIAVALGAHLILVLFMVMKRVFALTQNRLNEARTTTPPHRASRAS